MIGKHAAWRDILHALASSSFGAVQLHQLKSLIMPDMKLSGLTTCLLKLSQLEVLKLTNACVSVSSTCMPLLLLPYPTEFRDDTATDPRGYTPFTLGSDQLGHAHISR